jgi:hypothetical protein
MGVWATTDKTVVEAHQARVREAFEQALTSLGLSPRSLTVTYAPVGDGERTIKVCIEGLGDVR